MYETQRSSVGFFQAITLFFTRYTDFKGRSRRSEYWWVCLFHMAVSVVLYFLPGGLWWISPLWGLVILIPGLALCIRRLHDVGKSGWWYLFILLPLIGSVLLVVLFCLDSTGDNRWGPNPKA